MLVLSRDLKQTLHIGEFAVVHICAVKGNRVSLGIEASKDIDIKRGEHFKEEPIDESIVQWSYLGHGSWSGARDGIPLWHLAITAQGTFDASNSIPSRAYSLPFQSFRSLGAARRAIAKAEKSFATPTT